jgi:integrase
VDISVTLHEHKQKYKGKIYVYWILRWPDSTGRRRAKIIGKAGKDGLSRRQAEKVRQEKQNELDAKPGRRDVLHAPELGAFLEGYYAARTGELAEGTLELHRQTGRYLVAFFGEKRRLDTVAPAQARAFRTALGRGELARANKRDSKKPPEPTTVDRHVREARTIFRMALDDDLIRVNPFDKLGGLKTVVKEWHYVDEAEFAKLLDACTPAWKLMLGLARWGGLRSEEALELPWRKVDWDQRTIRIEPRQDWKPKDRDVRTLPIMPALYALLRAARDRDPDGAMVVPRAGVGPTNIWRDFQVVFRRAGVTPYDKPMHSLRKSCINDWAGEHASHVVKAWAGHSDYRTTATYYLQVSAADYRKAAGLPAEGAGGP